MKSRTIQNTLKGMRLVLCNGANGFQSDYHISSRGVPYVHVVVKGVRYQFTYMKTGGFFRIFDVESKVIDIKDRNGVISYFRRLGGRGD